MLQKVEIMIVILLIAAFVLINRKLEENVTSEQVKTEKLVIAVDAGHGGKDPGKVGINGELEKDINLQIAKRVQELLEEKDISVLMTREEDVNQGDKREDMDARVKLINEAKPDLAVSIHQNSFTDSSVKGAQVFYYSESEEGEIFAKLVQDELLEMDEDNRRMAKENNSYYLLKKTEVPVIIVECGFLSNPEEAEKLTTKEYQETISKAIVKGIESCFEN